MATVFISYSKKDYWGRGGKVIPGNPVDKICKALKDNGISYWIDMEGLAPGVKYAKEIASRIKECDVFLYLSSSEANRSDWTLREISTAINFGKTVLPVRLDHSNYADSVTLYLSAYQYVDWHEMGETESLHRIVSRIKNPGARENRPADTAHSLPKFTTFALRAAAVFLVFIYAVLTYQFLWSRQLRSSEIVGGLSGYVCEFGVLLSIYYIVRILRLRRCTFILPVLLSVIVFLAGMMIGDNSVRISAILLFGGWLAVLFVCLIGKERSFFKLMSKGQLMLKLSDPENLILIYLLIKAVILVLAHYFHLSVRHPLISSFLF